MAWSGPVWSGLVPADWSSPLLLGPAGHQQTSAKITAARCFPSSLDVWFSASSQTSSWALWRWRGFHSERRPGGSDRTSSWEQPGHNRGWTGLWTSRPNDVSEVSRPLRPGGPHTLLHSCSVQMVKYLSSINASAGPFDELSVDRRTKHSWSGQKIFVSAETMAAGMFHSSLFRIRCCFILQTFLESGGFSSAFHFSLHLMTHKKERIKESKKQKCFSKLCQHCFLIYLHEVLEDVFVLNVPGMTQRSNSRKDYLNLSFKLQLWCRMESAK